MLDWICGLDKAALYWIADNLRWEPLNTFFVLLTKLGNAGILWIVCSIVMLFFRRWRWAGISALVSMLICFLLGEVIVKNLVSRLRPPLEMTGYTALLTLPSGFSFPSGHTASSFAASGAYSRGVPKRWVKVMFFVLAALMGFSRLYVGVHYPTDVLAGAALGLAVGLVVWRLLQPLRERFEPKKIL